MHTAWLHHRSELRVNTHSDLVDSPFIPDNPILPGVHGRQLANCVLPEVFEYVPLGQGTEVGDPSGQ